MSVLSPVFYFYFYYMLWWDLFMFLLLGDVLYFVLKYHPYPTFVYPWVRAPPSTLIPGTRPLSTSTPSTLIPGTRPLRLKKREGWWYAKFKHPVPEYRHLKDFLVHLLFLAYSLTIFFLHFLLYLISYFLFYHFLLQ